MANRSYLYLIDFDRTQRKKEENDNMIALSEYNYEVPISFKILVSQDSRLSDSIIWNYDHPISVIGNFKKGVDKLINFLNDLIDQDLYDSNVINKLVLETKSFLDKKQHIDGYSFLEVGEIYEMGNEPFEEQHRKLFEEITNCDNMISDFIEVIYSKNEEIRELKELTVEPEKKGFFQNLFKPKTPTVDKGKISKEIEKIERFKLGLLGIDNWSEVLYYNFEKK